MSIFIAVGLVLQLAEGTFAVFNVPGAKIGLANVVTLINLFVFGGANTFIIAVLRAALGAILCGGPVAAMYAVSGAAVSSIVMYAVKKWFYPRLSITGISMIGASAHNMTQLAVAAITLKSAYVFSYASAALIFALCGGLITGCAASYMQERVSALKNFKSEQRF